MIYILTVADAGVWQYQFHMNDAYQFILYFLEFPKGKKSSHSADGHSLTFPPELSIWSDGSRKISTFPAFAVSAVAAKVLPEVSVTNLLTTAHASAYSYMVCFPSWRRGGDSCGNVEKWWHMFWYFKAGKGEKKNVL